ncbi:PA0069 family radical SAM protein [Sphingobium algorifonticola]|uniref:PA0069 family radical SAM protein n=1 Tax=Sphingobium algorifonticola TaxID=2008318 RepID=A0A437J6X6_9SPHN|nr:PA0069 family radical SAM protein [Sphingobium algorifonticola]RVT40756.1 PA0069 family radical SAM protein [Sphingobium algorifonticola]
MAGIRGRGATQNNESDRFSTAQRLEDGDWRDMAADVDGVAAPPRTSVTIERARTIIARNASPDIGFDQSINPYRGCEHGCIYCFARPSHAWHDLSPGLDFETKLFAKPDAAALLRRELGRRGYVVSPIAMGTNTDPYQPIERDWHITRQCIEVLAETRHPLFITTKSDRVLRDIDLLSAMARDNLVAVGISVTTLDAKVASTLEPRATHPERRIAAIARLADAGVPVHACVSPVIPAITDHEIETIVARVAAAGAQGVFWIPVRLPHEVAPLFRAWLDAHYPDRASKVMAIIRDIRGGRDNDPRFGHRMRGQGVWAELIRARFAKAKAKAGLPETRTVLRSDLFRPPEGDQLRLL